MKEVWLFTLASAQTETVQELGELGVVEIREIQAPSGERIERYTAQVRRAEQAITILAPYIPKQQSEIIRKKYNVDDPARVIDRILMAVDIRKQCQVALDRLVQQLQWYETWGRTINPKDRKYLQEKGLYVRLYLIDPIQAASLPTDTCLVTFAPQDKQMPVALVGRSADEKLVFEEQDWPVLPYREVRRQITRKQRQLEEVEYYLTDQADNIGLLHEYHTFLEDRLKRQKALRGMGDIKGRIKYLQGYIPYDAEQVFKEKGRQKNWGYQIGEPDSPAEVPVYLRNPKWVSIINPVLKFIDIVPGYKEVDVSIYFLVAFALFFAMLVGDAGYGMLFLGLTFLFRHKLSSQIQLLIYVLSGATIIWGVLSGTYFGAEQIATLPFLKNLILPEIASFGVDNIPFMMHLSFLIGAIHLTLAHAVRTSQLVPSVKALSEVGWIALVWGLFFVAEKLVLNKALPDWNTWLFVVGVGLVALFSREGKGKLNSLLNSLGNLPLSLINGFSDIVSYVRLFAVGMATAAVAASFNQMILPDGVDLSFLELLLAAVALCLGHGLNIILALMAVMVHGIRLNMLEFAGHLGVQFSGEAYRPFTLSASHHGVEEEVNN